MLRKELAYILQNARLKKFPAILSGLLIYMYFATYPGKVHDLVSKLLKGFWRLSKIYWSSDFSWHDVTPEQMISMGIEGQPYLGSYVDVTCNFSQYYYASGYRIVKEVLDLQGSLRESWNEYTGTLKLLSCTFVRFHQYEINPVLHTFTFLRRTRKNKYNAS
jgi:hypothetical protein